MHILPHQCSNPIETMQAFLAHIGFLRETFEPAYFQVRDIVDHYIKALVLLDHSFYSQCDPI